MNTQLELIRQKFIAANPEAKECGAQDEKATELIRGPESFVCLEMGSGAFKEYRAANIGCDRRGR